MLSGVNRFHRRNHVKQTLKKGTPVRGRWVSLKYTLSKQQTPTKVAVVVSKKVSKSAVNRNRIRRRVYGIVAPWINKLPQGAMIVISVFDEQMATTDAKIVTQEVERLLIKIK